jgi:putative flavoprotein involved in K+ transport
VVWCTGFHPGFSWIDLPAIRDETQQPNHHRGVMDDTPGLYFVGLKFLHSVSSEQIHGVGRDAAYIADAIKAQRAENRPDQPAARQEKHLKSA